MKAGGVVVEWRAGGRAIGGIQRGEGQHHGARVRIKAKDDTTGNID
jgi:hypothetical protein